MPDLIGRDELVRSHPVNELSMVDGHVGVDAPADPAQEAVQKVTAEAFYDNDDLSQSDDEHNFDPNPSQVQTMAQSSPERTQPDPIVTEDILTSDGADVSAVPVSDDAQSRASSLDLFTDDEVAELL